MCSTVAPKYIDMHFTDDSCMALFSKLQDSSELIGKRFNTPELEARAKEVNRPADLKTEKRLV